MRINTPDDVFDRKKRVPGQKKRLIDPGLATRIRFSALCAWSAGLGLRNVAICSASSCVRRARSSVANSGSSLPVAKKFPRHWILEDELNGHCYFEAGKLLDSQRLLIKVSGHTDEAPVHSFEHAFIFDYAAGCFEKPRAKQMRRAGLPPNWAPPQIKWPASKLGKRTPPDPKRVAQPGPRSASETALTQLAKHNAAAPV